MSKVKDETVKLAIISSLVNLLADWDLSIIDGLESELALKDGQVFTISVSRKREGQRRVPVNRK